MSGTVKASDGTDLPIDNLAHVYGYSGSNLVTDTVTYTANSTFATATFVKTFTYTGSNLTDESIWVKQ